MAFGSYGLTQNGNLPRAKYYLRYYLELQISRRVNHYYRDNRGLLCIYLNNVGSNRDHGGQTLLVCCYHQTEVISSFRSVHLHSCAFSPRAVPLPHIQTMSEKSHQGFRPRAVSVGERCSFQRPVLLDDYQVVGPGRTCIDALIRMMNKDFQGKAHTGTQDKSRLISTMALYMAHGKDVYKVE